MWLCVGMQGHQWKETATHDHAGNANNQINRVSACNIIITELGKCTYTAIKFLTYGWCVKAI